MLKGWKTILFNAAVAIVGVLQAVDWIDVLGSERAGIVVTGIGLVGTVLRFLTNTPALQSRSAG